MAVRTATVAGNWSSTATWGGSAPPGIGDSAVINVAVTLDADATVGTAGIAGTAAVTVAATGSLTFAADRTLTLRGDLLVSGTSNTDPLTQVRMTLAEGCTVAFDMVNAPAGVQYVYRVGTAANQTPSLRVRGTQAKPCTWKSNLGGGALTAYYGGGNFINQGSIDAEWLDFVDVGDAANASWKPYMGSNDRHYVRLVNCTFTRCGQLWGAAAFTGGVTWLLDHVKFIDSAATSYCMNVTAATAKTTGTRSCSYVSFDKKITAAGLKDFSFDHCVFMNIWVSTAAAWASFTNNFFRDTTATAMTVFGDVTDSYFFKDASGTNPHGFGAGTLDADVVYSGCVIESVLGGAGDFVFAHSPANPRTTTLRNMLLIPCDPAVNAGAESPGKIFGMLVGPNATGIVEHCTYAVWQSGETGVNVGETYLGRAGQIASLRSNLAWRRVAGTAGYKFNRLPSSGVQDPVSASNADYNWGWNLAAGSAGNGYNADNAGTPLFSTGTPGVHDGSGDPGFVDSTRNLVKWAVSRGSVAATDALKRADAYAYLSADPALIDDLIAYVRAGFAPTNPAMAAAAHDAGSPTTLALGTPGAVAYAGVQDPYAYDTFGGRTKMDLLYHVGQVGATWARHPAFTGTGDGLGWRSDDFGRIYCYNGGTNSAHALASGASTEAEYDVVSIWHFHSHLTAVSHGIVCHYDDTADSGYRVVYQHSPTYRRWAIHKVVNGVATSLGNYPDPLVAGADYTVRVQLRTTGITVLIDGVSRITSTDTTFAATPGRVGLWGNGDAGAGGETGLHLGLLAVVTPGAALPGLVLSGPPTGVPGLASWPFAAALALGVAPAGTVTVTPSATGIPGAFAPTTLALTNTTRSGTFTFTPSGTAADSGTIAVANNGGLLASPSIAFSTGYTPPSRLAPWQSRIGWSHSTGASPYVAGPATNATGGRNFDAEGGEHYDPIHCMISARDYCVRNGLQWTDWSEQIAAGIVRYRDRWILYNKTNTFTTGQPQWHHRYSAGLAEHYRETGDPLDLEAIDYLLPVTGSTSMILEQHNPARYTAIYETMANSRPVAFQLLIMLDREWCGMGGEHPLLDEAAFNLLSMCDQWTGGTHWGTWTKPFMTGLVARALIAFWDRYKDTADPTRSALVARIPDAILGVCDYLWDLATVYPDNAVSRRDTQVVMQYPDPDEPLVAKITGLTIQSVIAASSTFTGPSTLSAADDYYRFAGAEVTGDNSSASGRILSYEGATRKFILSTYSAAHTLAVGQAFYLTSGIDVTVGPYGTPILNPMVSPMYAWAYWYCKRILGDHAAAVIYRDRHDELFNGQTTAWSDVDTPKQYNQIWEWGSLWSDWRDRGDAEWPDATAFALQAPATGAAGPHSVASGPFRLALPYGVKTAAPVVVTPSSTSGRGTFSPATAILTPDRPTAMFTFTPSSLDDGTSPTVEVSASGLTAPAGVAYAVGAVASSTRRTFRVGPRFDRSPTTRSSLVR